MDKKNKTAENFYFYSTQPNSLLFGVFSIWGDKPLFFVFHLSYLSVLTVFVFYLY